MEKPNVTEQKIERSEKKSECRALPFKRNRVAITFTYPSKTQQAHAAECDINNIVARYKQTGILPEIARQGVFGDVSNIPDYQTALNIVEDAEKAFMALPAKVRERFGHNPGELVDFVQDVKNREEAIKLGLISPEPLEGGDTPQKTQNQAVSGDSGKGSQK